jgi:hypothetical protein
MLLTRTRQDRTGQGRARQGKARLEGTKHDRTDQGKTGAETVMTGDCRTGQDRRVHDST